MDYSPNFNIEAAFVLIISSVGSIIGLLTLLFFTSNAFYNFNLSFFIISLLSQCVSLAIDYSSDQRRTAPKKILYNPHFHNFVSYLCFSLTNTASIFYIIDTIFLHLNNFAHYIQIKDVRKVLMEFTESKSTRKILQYIEIFVIPELLLWFLFTFSIAKLFCLIVYVVSITMFSYATMKESTEFWRNIYSTIKKQARLSNGPTKTVMDVFLRVGDCLNNVSTQLYQNPYLNMMI